MIPRMIPNKRGSNWINHPNKIYLYDGWCVVHEPSGSGGNPRLSVYFNQKQEPDIRGRIEVFDVWLPHKE